MKVDELIADASQKLGHHPIGVRAVLSRVSEQRLDRVMMLGTWWIGSYHVKDGDCVNCEVCDDELRCKKPVIYPYSPSDVDVSIKLSLIPEWSLSVIYPVVAIEEHGQRLEWNVQPAVSMIWIQLSFQWTK